MACIRCDGRDDECPDCKGTGRFVIAGCVREYAADVLPFISLARWADDGLLPVAGGVLDQAKSFMSALSFYRSEMARWKISHGRQG